MLIGTAMGAAAPAAHATPARAPLAAPAVPVDLNSATLEQLKTLPGMGDAQARSIVAARPLHSKTDLVTAQLIPAGLYLSIRHQVVALPPGARRR